MKCERCRRRDAVVKYIEVEEGVKRTRWLCEPCAAEEGAHYPGEGAGQSGPDLQVFLDAESPGAAEPEPEATPCPSCGTEFAALHNQGLLGCADCYDHFEERLQPLLRRYHRAVIHLGKAPGARGPRAALWLEIAQLRSRLEKAVAEEDFEDAAGLRDRITVLRDQLSKESGRPDPEAP